ncbi:MAG: 3-oxoacyl-[acyl-carrier protein] reductase [Gammaproteobacteria bacterium]|jgi:3-oxoacyl-[acyl-carrier protein] reductase
MSRLEHKTVVVTGASSGIGESIATTFAREGAHVVVNYNSSKEKAEYIVKQIKGAGGKAVAIRANVSNPKDVAFLIDEAISELGQIDIWVNNAGADILTGKGAELSEPEKLQSLIDVDLKGTINCCWGILPVMEQAGQGSIINMTWDLAIHGFRGRNPQMFAAVKAGVRGFSQSLAKTVAPDIRVNLVAPGWIETAFADEIMQTTYYQERISEIPLRRFGQPQDVANAALYLASDEASYITGQIININGGLI